MGSFLSSISQVPPACSPAAPAATAACPPQWMLLAPYGGGKGEACNITGDSKTIAAAITSNGDRISVSLGREPFSVLSRICLCYLPRTGDRCYTTWAGSTVIAAHAGSVLVGISSREHRYGAPYAVDYFVYNNVIAAAAEPARPPSLYLLPARWSLDICATGFLRCGEAEFVVAEHKIVGSKDDAAAASASAAAFELRLFRDGKWSVKQPWIIHGHGIGKYRKQLCARWETIAVVPLGNGMLCWVDRYSGVIFSDVLEEGPNSLRYVPYPAEAARPIYINVSGELKLVRMSPRRCSYCGCSEHAVAIDIWTLKTDDMEWVLETETNMVDSTHLWRLPDTPGYARTHLVYPIASMNGSGHVVPSKNSGVDVVSDESAAPMEEEGEDDMSPCACTPSVTASLHGGLQSGNGATSASTGDQQQATASLHDRLEEGNEATTSASAGDQQQVDNGLASVGRWPKRRRRANTRVTGPEWIA